MDKILVVLIGILSGIASESIKFAKDKPKLLLVSFDGFRHDYIEMYSLHDSKTLIHLANINKIFIKILITLKTLNTSIL